MIVEVVVDVNNKAVDRMFDYTVPADLQELISPGMRVIAPFGPRKLTGFVLKVKEKSDFEGKLRSILSIVDLVPVLNAELLQLGIELAEETGATKIACFDAMLPAAMRSKYTKKYRLLQDGDLPLEVVALFEKKAIIDERVVPKELLKDLKKGIDAGQIELIYHVASAAKEKTVRYVELVDPNFDVATISPRAKKQIEVAQRLIENGQPMTKKELDVATCVLERLMAQGIVRFTDEEVYRAPLIDVSEMEKQRRDLNAAQLDAVELIKEAGNKTVLIHGITGSGKTEVYLEAIANVIAAGKEALVLIPEISLTTQLTGRFKQRFGDKIAVLHSGLSIGERYDEWRRILRKEASIVIGARSAVFAPLTNLGLIVVDEEHEATYKQEEMPRYHAIEVAKKRAAYHGCPVVLGSATPTLDSYARAKKGVYELATLPHRAVSDMELPQVKLIDMSEMGALASGELISEALSQAITDRLAKKEQVILFLNRRGYSNFMQCRDCSEVVSCPNCDVTLTYHKAKNGLNCHYCDFTARVLTECLACESKEIRFFGTGTEKIEEFLVQKFPGANVLRMDMDTTRNKGDHHRIIRAFENREADILIGTQMVAKGLDFEHVTLVGVLNADLMLHFPDFKAAERTFQILTQVAGRAGRHKLGAEVLIETYSPTHYVMEQVKNQDYETFYGLEMMTRKQFGYAPFFFHAKVLLTSVDPEDLMVTSGQVNDYLREHLEGECLIVGPATPVVARVNNRFRMHFILKYKKAPRLREVMSNMLEVMVFNENVSIAVDYFPVYLG